MLVPEELKQKAEDLLTLAALVESSDDAIIGKTTDGIITSWSAGAERIYGYTREEMVGRSISLLVPPENVDDLTYILDSVRRGERVQRLEAIRRCKHGQRVVMSLTVSPIRDMDGRIVGAATIGRDITERKSAENKIQQLNEALRAKAIRLDEDLESFSYSVSHDLRAPLRHMSGFLEMLDDQIGGNLDEKGRHYLDVVIESARLMGCLIDDLLDFSRSGRVKMRESKVDLGGLVRKVQQELSPDLQDRQVVWTVEPLPEVTGDLPLLRQLIVNLLANAIKYTRTRGLATIEIACREAGEEWIFLVRDNGVGFDMRYVHKLFGVFQRLHSAEEFAGTGIGLATAKRIVTRHGGRIWAEARVGEGATFYFSLPRTPVINEVGASPAITEKDQV